MDQFPSDFNGAAAQTAVAEAPAEKLCRRCGENPVRPRLGRRGCAPELCEGCVGLCKSPESPVALAAGRRLRARREALGLKTNSLARRAGLKPSAVARMEFGRAAGNPWKWVRMAEALDCTLDWLLSGKPPVERPAA